MSANQFKVGDTVRLKSGGPLMTVSSLATDLDGSPLINTVWFDKNHTECSGQYGEALVEEDDGTAPIS